MTGATSGEGKNYSLKHLNSSVPSQESARSCLSASGVSLVRECGIVFVFILFIVKCEGCSGNRKTLHYLLMRKICSCEIPKIKILQTVNKSYR